MPPNLGGFFMVRSYYPSECHADYFDFERIEALKPAIEACGITTLSQSPTLGFHKQMDNRIKLLEEILSFRMQGVEFDNGDMYVDGHKAASDVRDEFVSVTEKLMDELAQCYNLLPQLDINNTIDHRPEGDEKSFLENEKTVTQFCRKLATGKLKIGKDKGNKAEKGGICFRPTRRRCRGGMKRWVSYPRFVLGGIRASRGSWKETGGSEKKKRRPRRYVARAFGWS